MDIKARKTLFFSSIISNIMEFYDLALFGFLAPIISPLFFPTNNPTSSILLTLGTFSLGFITRPLGAIIFGYVGDRHGRKKSLLLSIILMSIPTVCIGLLPSYSTIGLAAPFLITLCRLLQGLCVGGEYNGSAIFFLEHSPQEKRGISGALIASSAVFGFLIASLTSLFWLQPWAPSWGWRVPFFIGGLIGLLGFFVRRKLIETPQFQEIKK